MKINFGEKKSNVTFEVLDGKIFLKEMSFNGKTYLSYPKGNVNSYVYLLDGNYRRKQFGRYSLVGENLCYVNHFESENESGKTLTVVEKNQLIEVVTYYRLCSKYSTVQVYKEVKNITDKKLCLECVSPFTAAGTMNGNDKPNAKEKLPYLWKGHNTWCSEVGFERIDLNKEGLRAFEITKKCGKVNVSSNGTQTTSRYVPLGVLEKDNCGFFAFEIEPIGSWSYELEF